MRRLFGRTVHGSFTYMPARNDVLLPPSGNETARHQERSGNRYFDSTPPPLSTMGDPCEHVPVLDAPKAKQHARESMFTAQMTK